MRVLKNIKIKEPSKEKTKAKKTQDKRGVLRLLYAVACIEAKTQFTLANSSIKYNFCLTNGNCLPKFLREKKTAILHTAYASRS